MEAKDAVATAAPSNERPILFSGPMVRALLNGTKTQTRRVLKPQANPIPYEAPFPPNPKAVYNSGWFLGEPAPQYVIDLCPYGKPGDRLWVRESTYVAPPNFGDRDLDNCTDNEGRRRLVGYAATMDGESVRCATDYGVKLSPSIHMPRWASRIQLEVMAVRVERLQDISEADAQAEGVERHPDSPYWKGELHPIKGEPKFRPNARDAYADLWNGINGKDSWEASPWVWVIEFQRVSESHQNKIGEAT